MPNLDGLEWMIVSINCYQLWGKINKSELNEPILKKLYLYNNRKKGFENENCPQQ